MNDVFQALRILNAWRFNDDAVFTLGLDGDFADTVRVETRAKLGDGLAKGVASDFFFLCVGEFHFDFTAHTAHFEACGSDGTTNRLVERPHDAHGGFDLIRVTWAEPNGLTLNTHLYVGNALCAAQ